MSLKKLNEVLEKIRRHPVVQTIESLRAFWLVLLVTIWQAGRTLFVPDLAIEHTLIEVPSMALEPMDGDTRQQLLLTVVNNSDQRLADLDVQVNGVRDVQSLLYTTPSRVLNSEIARIKTQYELSNSGILDLALLRSMPPRSTVSFSISGTFFSPPYTSRISAISSSKSLRIYQGKIVTGLTRVLDDNLIVILLVLAALTLVRDVRSLPRK